MEKIFPLVIFLLLFCAPVAFSQETTIVPPALGQPKDFSKLVGQFDITTTAAPTEVFVEEPIVLMVSIRKLPGVPINKRYLPRREHLKIFPPEMEKTFFIGPVPGRQDRVDAGTGTWDFYYQLLPRHEGVARIPSLRLMYFNPQFSRYQPSFSREIPLTVKLRPHVIVAPERMYRLAEGEEVLRTTERISFGWLHLLLGLFLPPLGSLAGYQLWRYVFPDQANLIKRRQSRAARQALKELRRLRDDPHGWQSCAVFSHYLRARLDLPAVEPTPRETATHLDKAGLSSRLIEQVSHFYRVADEARFAPNGMAGQSSLKEKAIQLITSVEEEVR